MRFLRLHSPDVIDVFLSDLRAYVSAALKNPQAAGAKRAGAVYATIGWELMRATGSKRRDKSRAHMIGKRLVQRFLGVNAGGGRLVGRRESLLPPGYADVSWQDF